MKSRGTQHATADAPDTSVPKRHNKYARWRAASLAFVYVLMGIHVAHWKITGKTLAPLELNEVMYTLELGIITAGLIFMLTAIIATAVFGRFFCSWGCHILALQDLSTWILRKLRIKPRAIRSRLLLWVPIMAALYMFAWPQVSRIARGESMAKLRLADDADGWASFTTENYWRNLPGPAVTAFTFLACGFGIVCVLGTRSFCAYGCPYGAIFGLSDRIAPGRIRVGDDCEQCGTCTSVCTSHVRVHEEVNRFGMVVNPACLKDLDCVAACPQQTLRFGFGRPSLFSRAIGTATVKKPFDFALWEEAAAALVFVVILVTYRGLYDWVPFLMTLALGAILSYCALVSIRLVRRRDVSLNRLRLRRAGALTRSGVAFAACMLFVGVLTIHSAVVQYSLFQGERLHASIPNMQKPDADVADRSIAHLMRAQSWGLIPLDRIERMLADLFTNRERWTEAEASWRTLLKRRPGDAHIRGQLAFSLTKQGRFDEARQDYARSLQIDPDRAESYYGLAGVEFEARRPDLAEAHLRRALQIRPDFVPAHYDLGALLLKRGAADEGIYHLRECVRTNPKYGDAYYNLAVAFATRGAFDEAKVEIEKAISLQPDDEQTQKFRAWLMTQMQNQ